MIPNLEPSKQEQQDSVEIPPISLRAKYFYKLLSTVGAITQGKLVREKQKLMEMTLGFKPHSVNGTEEISKVFTLLERLEHEATEDARLSGNCKKYKLKVYKEVRWLLLLRALTYLKYSDRHPDPKEKDHILSILGFAGSHTHIDDYRIECLKNGCGSDMDIVRLTENLRSLYRFQQMGFCAAKQILSPLLYYASCFAQDHPEIKKLFGSKEWNYDAKRYIIR